MRFALLGALLLTLSACNQADGSRLQGYVEGEYVRIAAPLAGRLDKLHVQRGSNVGAGAPLFELEQAREAAAVTEGGESIAAIRAQAEQAQAAFQLADRNLKRQRELKAKGLTSQEQVDAAQAEFERASARRREADALRRSSEASLQQVRWSLDQRRGIAPAAALVEDTYYRVGEWVPAGAPVVSLLPPENRMIRFFVPEEQLATVKVGQGVRVFRDGVDAPVAATISYIAPRAEFTPPVIYSRESRAKLVFLVEARPAPADAVALNPGQPVDVELVQ